MTITATTWLMRPSWADLVQWQETAGGNGRLDIRLDFTHFRVA